MEAVEEIGAVVLAKLAELTAELTTELATELATELDSADETVAWVEVALEVVSTELAEELEDSVAALEASDVEVTDSEVEVGTAVSIPAFARASEIAPINLVEYHGTPVIILVTSSPAIPVNIVVKSPPAKTALAISGGYVSVLCKAWKA